MRRLGLLFKTTLLLSILTGLFLAVGYFLAGRTGALIALGLASLFNLGSFWFSHTLVLKMQWAKPLDTSKYPDIERMVRELAAADNLPMPKLYFVDTPLPNAFATGRSHKKGVVAVTRGITELLTPEELRSVLAHELGHIKNRDMLVSTIAATIGGGISMLVEFAFWGGALFGGSSNEDEDRNPLVMLVSFIVAPISALLIQMAVSRSREFLADQHGAQLVGHGRHLASALQKLEMVKDNVRDYQPSPREQATAHLMFANLFSGGGLASLFSTHPTTQARVNKLIGKRARV